MSTATLTGGPVIGLLAAIGAMWIRLTELCHGSRPQPVVDTASYALAVARIECLAGSPDPDDQAAAYLTVLAAIRWLRWDLAHSSDLGRRIARASALEVWEMTAEAMQRQYAGRPT